MTASPRFTSGLQASLSPRECALTNSNRPFRIIGSQIDVAGILISIFTVFSVAERTVAETPLWDFEAPNGGVGRFVKTDSSNNVYVAGEDGFDDLYVAKFAPNGTLLWEDTYGGTGGGIDTPEGLAVDAAGNAYVVATIVYDDGTRDRDTCALIKWTNAGVRSWVRVALGQSTASYGRGVALDEANNRVFVTATTTHPTQNINLMTLRYTTGGNTVWAAPAYYNNGRTDDAGDITVGADGAVYVSGESEFNDGTWHSRVLLLKYDPASGAQTWAKRNDDVADYRPTAMVKDSSGNLLLSCSGSVMKFSTAGARLWRASYSEYLRDLDVNSAGDVYALYAGEPSPFIQPGEIAKFRGSDGLLLWSTEVRVQDCDVFCEAIRVVPGSDSAWVAGQRRQCDAGTPEAFAWAKYGTSGTQTSSALRSLSEDSRARSLAIDSCGALCMTGESDTGVATLKAVHLYGVSDDAFATNEDVPLQNANVGANDAQIHCGLTFLKKTNPLHGTASITPDTGLLTYTPSANWSGTDTLTYVFTDGVWESPAATVTITVNAVNDPPVAVDDSYATNEDTTLDVPTLGVLANDSDVDTPSSNLRTKVKTQPTHGVVTVGSRGDFRFVPFDDYNGPDSFQYELYELATPTNSDIGTVNITVTAVDDPPVALDDTYAATEDAALDVASLGVLSNDTDIDTPTSNLRTQVHRQPLHGVVTVGSRGDFRYVPLANYAGPDDFQYEVYELGDPSKNDIGTVNINVAAVNDPPIAQSDSYNATEDVALSISAPGVLGNDSDIDSPGITAVKETNPTHGTVTLNSNGSFVYTPAPNYNGPDSFKYHGRDASGANSASTTVSITISPSPDTPVAVDDAYAIAPNLPKFVPASEGVLGNDTDADQDALHCTLFAPALHGAVLLNSDGSFIYSPPGGYTGTDTFVYKALDPGGRFDLAVVTMTIGAPCEPCDTNCNGTVNQFDIQPFIDALISHTACSPCAADANQDGTVNQFDINAFIDCLIP